MGARALSCISDFGLDHLSKQRRIDTWAKAMYNIILPIINTSITPAVVIGHLIFHFPSIYLDIKCPISRTIIGNFPKTFGVIFLILKH